MTQSSQTASNPDRVKMRWRGEERLVPRDLVDTVLESGGELVEPTADEPHWSERVWDTMQAAPGVVADVGIGAGKSALRSVMGAGKWARENIPGAQALHDAGGGDWATIDMATLEPTSRAQELGGTAERVGEFFIPVGGAVGGVAKRVPALMRSIPWLERGVESASAGGLTLAHGGTVPEALTAAALQGIIPSTPRTAGVVRESAESTVARALDPTTRAAKAKSAELAPEMLARGVGGSRTGMLEEATSQIGRLGPQIGEEVTRLANLGRGAGPKWQRGATVKTSDFMQDMRSARVRSQGGRLSEGVSGPVYGTESIINKLDEIEAFALKQGDELPIEHAQAIKQVWSDIVSKSGLYGQRADAAPTDRAAAWVFREGANSLRELISAKSPTIGRLNAEFSFWKGLEDVLSATALRTQGQSTALTQTLTGGFGGAITASATGSTLQGLLGMAGTNMLSRLFLSSYFRTKVSGPLKAKLADALAAGDQGLVLQAISNIAASFPSVRSELMPSTTWGP